MDGSLTEVGERRTGIPREREGFAIVADDALFPSRELPQRDRRVAELHGRRSTEANGLTELQLDDEGSASVRVGARHIDGDEVASECALTGSIEPEIRAPREELACELELVALESKELPLLPRCGKLGYGITPSEGAARKAQIERLNRLHLSGATIAAENVITRPGFGKGRGTRRRARVTNR